jgi:hypothetical protein
MRRWWKRLFEGATDQSIMEGIGGLCILAAVIMVVIAVVLNLAGVL